MLNPKPQEKLKLDLSVACIFSVSFLYPNQIAPFTKYKNQKKGSEPIFRSYLTENAINMRHLFEQYHFLSETSERLKTLEIPNF